MYEVFEIKQKTKSSPLVLILRWGIPALFVIFGILLLMLSHGHLSGVQDNGAGSTVFTQTPTNRDSILSAMGVGSIVVALMLWMVGWMARLSFASDDDRIQEDDDRKYFSEHGRWRSDEPDQD